MGIIREIERVALPGIVIPKPDTKMQKIKGWGHSRGERALVYTIPNKKDNTKLSSKRVKESDFRKTHDQLIKNGTFTKQWFAENLPECSKDGDCNFTTIGGIFVLLGVAEYAEPGVYRFVLSK